MSFTLRNIPERVKAYSGDTLDNCFRVARGRFVPSVDEEAGCPGVNAGEMTMWFDTSYHYIVLELTADTSFKLDASRLLQELTEVKSLGITVKPVIVGPVTYLSLGKTKDWSDKLDLFSGIVPVYVELFAGEGIEWVQIDDQYLLPSSLLNGRMPSAEPMKS